jgi:hypothetical protein
MKKYNEGFSVVEVLILITVIGLLGFAGWSVYKNQNNTDSVTEETNSQANQQEIAQEKPDDKIESSDPYEGWKSGSFKYTDLTYKVPPDWEDISDNSKFQDVGSTYEEVKLRASDGFVLTMSVNDLPRGYESEPDNTVLEFKDIDDTHQWVIADNTNGKVSMIYVGSGIKNIGEKILPVANVGRDGLNIELSAQYDSEFDSLSAFNEKQSVIEAKLVFESLVF